MKFCNRNIVIEKFNCDLSQVSNICIIGVLTENFYTTKTYSCVIECIKSGLDADIILIEDKDKDLITKTYGVSIYPMLIVNKSYVGSSVVILEKIKTREYTLESNTIKVFSNRDLKLMDLPKKKKQINKYNPIWTISNNSDQLSYATMSGELYHNGKIVLQKSNWINKLVMDESHIFLVGNEGKLHKVDIHTHIEYTSNYIHDSWLNCIMLFNDKLIVGTTNGNILIYDKESLKLLKKIHISTQEVWALCKNSTYIIIGLNNGDIIKLDFSFTLLLTAGNVKFAITSFKQENEVIYFSTINGDLGSIKNESIQVYSSKYERIWDFDLLNNNIIFASTSGYLVKYNIENRSFKLIREDIYTSVCCDNISNTIYCGHYTGNLISINI